MLLCFNRCQASDDCAGFILDYQRASCFRVTQADMNINEYIPAKNSNFFLKICIQGTLHLINSFIN